MEKTKVENSELYTSSEEQTLVIKTKEGCGQSQNKLIRFMSKTIKYCTNKTLYKFRNITHEKEDLENQLCMELIKLTYKFDEERGVKYWSYINELLPKRATNYCLALTRGSHKVTNFAVELKHEEYSVKEENILSEIKYQLENDLSLRKHLDEIEFAILYSYINEEKVESVRNELGISLSSYYRHRKSAIEKYGQYYELDKN